MSKRHRSKKNLIQQKYKKKSATKTNNNNNTQIGFQRKGISRQISIASDKLSHWFIPESSIESKRDLIRAPYNFISFPQTNEDILSIDAYTSRNALNDELLSGRIDYTIIAETPIFIGDGKKENEEFYKDTKDYAIPSSSIRGMIRENVQILGKSDPSDDIDDYLLMYRDIASGASRNFYQTKLGVRQEKIGKDKKGNDINHTILKNVKAGYIEACKNGSYKIYPAKAEYQRQKDPMTYYVMNERDILKDKSKFSYIISNLQFKQIRKNKDGSDESIPNKDFKAIYKEISYEAKDHHIIKIDCSGKLGSNGYMLISGPMHNKKAVYVIPEIDSSKEPITVSEDDIRSFQIDYNKRENTLNDKKAIPNFFKLPETGKKPVFYFQDGGHTYFGFTPFLRIFYNYSIKDGIHIKDDMKDYAKNMFGFSNETSSYKSKLSFSNARIQSENVYGVGEIKLPLLEPKPTDYLNYLVQNENDLKQVQTYNTKGFSLRGYKQYWLKDKAVVLENEKEGNFYSTFHPLAPGTTFKGTVYFNNLMEEELGLLLWAMKIDDKAYQNIGKGKAYGYGRIKLSIDKVEKVNNRDAYNLQSLNLSPFTLLDVDDEIAVYQNEIRKKYHKNIENDPGVKAFIQMKTMIPDVSQTTYMNLKEFKYAKSKLKPLPTVKEVLKGNK